MNKIILALALLGTCVLAAPAMAHESVALMKKLVLEHQSVEAQGNMVKIRGAVRNISDHAVAPIMLKTTCRKMGQREDVGFSIGDVRDETQIAYPGKALRFIVEIPLIEPVSDCGKLAITGFNVAD